MKAVWTLAFHVGRLKLRGGLGEVLLTCGLGNLQETLACRKFCIRFPSPPRTYYLGTGALKGPLGAYYLGTWGARDF